MSRAGALSPHLLSLAVSSLSPHWEPLHLSSLLQSAHTSKLLDLELASSVGGVPASYAPEEAAVALAALAGAGARQSSCPLALQLVQSLVAVPNPPKKSPTLTPASRFLARIQSLSQAVARSDIGSPPPGAPSSWPFSFPPPPQAQFLSPRAISVSCLAVARLSSFPGGGGGAGRRGALIDRLASASLKADWGAQEVHRRIGNSASPTEMLHCVHALSSEDAKNAGLALDLISSAAAPAWARGDHNTVVKRPTPILAVSFAILPVLVGGGCKALQPEA